MVQQKRWGVFSPYDYPSPSHTGRIMIPLALEGLTSPPALLMTLVLLAAMVLVGRVLLHIAWKLLLLAIGAVAILWVLGVFL